MGVTVKSSRRRFTLHPQALTLEQSCQKAHAFASQYPTLYRLHVRALIAAYLILPFFTTLFMVALTVGFPWAFEHSEFLQPIYSVPLLRWGMFGFFYATWIPLVAAYTAGVYRGLTLELPQFAGIRLAEKDAPRLFRMLAELSRTLDVPPISKALVSPEHTLEIRNLPRGARGIFGRAETVLVAGLPVLEELSPQHLRALLAHEMAHLATHKRRFGGHVLAFRARMNAFRQAAQSSALDGGYWSCLPDQALTDILNGILRKLTPATFPAARQHEAEADAIAAAVAGREFAAAALLRQRIAGHALSQTFRDDCLHLAETQPEPPADLFERRAAAAAGPFTEAQIHSWLRGELEQKDDLAESHPPIWDRLRLLGYQLGGMEDFHELMEQVQPHRPLGETAARFFLGDAAEPLRETFLGEWRSRQTQDWRTRFETYEKLRAVAAGWDPVRAASMNDPDALWQIAVAIGNTRTWRDALPVAQRILEIHPGHGDANLLLGQLLIEDGSPAGLEALQLAMAANDGVIPLACALAARFLESRGEQEAAAGYRKRAEEQRKAEEAGAEARRHVRATDSFSPACCPEETLEALRRALEPHASHIRATYLMRKNVPGEDHKVLHVLGVERRAFIYENPGLANRLLLDRIARGHTIPPGILVCVVTRANRALLDKWKAVPGSRLWPSPAQQAPQLLLPLERASQAAQFVAPPLDSARHPAMAAPASPAGPK